MGPFKAATRFKAKYPEADAFRVVLYGSLALTGKGHMTDAVILEALGEDKTEMIFDKTSPTPVHPNTVDFAAFKNGEQIGTERVYSVGGGSILYDGQGPLETKSIYPHKTFTEIAEYCTAWNMDEKFAETDAAVRLF
jgi:L-serine dehydratase